MLTTATHLEIRRPSPTTAEFTVTTRPNPSLGLSAILVLLFLGRVVLAAAALHMLAAKFGPALAETVLPALLGQPPRPRTWAAAAASAPRAALASPPARLLAALAASSPAWAVAPLCGTLLYVSLLRVHTSESLLVLRGLGVQTRSHGAAFLLPGGAGAGANRFIPTEKVRDVLINEAFRGFEVRYYLVVVVEGEEDLVVVFPRLLPRRHIVEAVWRAARECLYEPDAVRVVEDKS